MMYTLSTDFKKIELTKEVNKKLNIYGNILASGDKSLRMFTTFEKITAT